MNEGKRIPQNTRLTPGYIEVIVIVLIIVIGAFYGYDRYFAQKIKIVDMSGHFRQQKALLAAGEITETDFKANLNMMDALISKDADLHKNQVYILKEVVLKNGNELILK